MTSNPVPAAEAGIPAARWFAKKAARTMLSAITAPTTLSRLLLDRRPNVRVLTYHRFGDGGRAPFMVSADAFKRQMAFVASSGRAVSLNDVRSFLAGKTTLPANAVLVTIDDGDPSVLELAMPILQKHRIPAVAFVLAGAPDGFPVMSGGQLRDLARGGVDIGSHSVSHRSIARLSPDQMRYEASESRRRLEDTLGGPITSFAYPFGTRADYSEAAAGILREAGYDIAFTSQHGTIRQGMDTMLLPRVKVESGDPGWHFPLLCKGGMDAWRLVDVTLSRVQRPA